MSFTLISIPNKEALIPSITEENFNYLKAIPEESVKDEAKLTARVRNFVALKSLLQETGVPVLLEEKDFNDFDVDEATFRQWLIEKKVNFPYVKEYHPQTGKQLFKIRLVQQEYGIDLYARSLPDLYVKAYYFSNRSTVLINYQSEVVFIDRWLVVQDYENYEAMQNAFKTFQEAVEKKADEFIKQQDKMQQEAIESVSEGNNEDHSEGKDTEEE